MADWGVPATWFPDDPLFDTGDFNAMTTNPAATIPAHGPAALIRGGSFDDGSLAGVFSIDGLIRPSEADKFLGLRLGFRCGR